MLFADDIVFCGGKEYRGLRVSRSKTQFMDFTFEQSEQGNQQPSPLGNLTEIGGQDYKRFSSMDWCSTHNMCSEMT